jgi:hypothetical protein
VCSYDAVSLFYLELYVKLSIYLSIYLSLYVKLKVKEANCITYRYRYRDILTTIGKSASFWAQKENLD